MADEKNQGDGRSGHDDDVQKALDEHSKRRRELLKKSAKIAVTTPAVAALLAPGSRPAMAGRYAPKTTTKAPTTTETSTSTTTSTTPA